MRGVVFALPTGDASSAADTGEGSAEQQGLKRKQNSSRRGRALADGRADSCQGRASPPRFSPAMGNVAWHPRARTRCGCCRAGFRAPRATLGSALVAAGHGVCRPQCRDPHGSSMAALASSLPPKHHPVQLGKDLKSINRAPMVRCCWLYSRKPLLDRPTMAPLSLGRGAGDAGGLESAPEEPSFPAPCRCLRCFKDLKHPGTKSCQLTIRQACQGEGRWLR